MLTGFMLSAECILGNDLYCIIYIFTIYCISVTD